MSRSLLQRLAASAVLMVVTLAALGAGSPFWTLLVAVVAAVMSWEWTSMTQAGRFGLVGSAALATIVLAILATDGFGLSPGLGLLAAGALLVGLLAGRAPPRRAPLWPLSGIAYVGLPAIALVWLRDDESGGFATCLWLLALVWAVDSAAYFVGRAVGGPKLAPALSPKKTWAGLLGGCAGAALVSVVAAIWLGIEWLPLVGLGILLAVIEQGGDLVESALKRRFKVKDSSNLIPGHGGILDRVDGLVAVALAVAAIAFFADGTPLGP